MRSVIYPGFSASTSAAAALTAGPGRDQHRARSLHRFLFAAGGPVHGAGLALLLGALGVAGRRTGALPRPLTTAALASAGVDALAPVVLAGAKAALVVPAGRFPPSSCWLSAVSAWAAVQELAEIRRALVTGASPGDGRALVTELTGRRGLV